MTPGWCPHSGALKLIKAPETLDAVEYFGFPVDGVFEDGEAVAGRFQQDLLGGWVEIGRGVTAKFGGDFASASHQRIRWRLVGKLGTLGFDAERCQLMEPFL